MNSESVCNQDSLTIDLSWSLWNEFFHYSHNDHYKAIHQHINCTYIQFIIKQPVYIIPMITFHVGHVLIDIIDQLFFSMIKQYGKVRKDAIIIIDVASKEEQNVLSKKLQTFLDLNNIQSSINILFSLTDNIYSIDLLHQINELDNVLFEDVNIGMDLTSSFFYQGYQNHPCILSLTTSNCNDLSLAFQYQFFANFVSKYSKTNLFNHSTATPNDNICVNSTQDVIENEILQHGNVLKVLIVQRQENRMIINLDELLDVLEQYEDIEYIVKDLAVLTFYEQHSLFNQVDIIIGVAGTALHNILLTSRTTDSSFKSKIVSVIILMQSEWCEWAWMYANQVVLMGFTPYIYCSNQSVKGQLLQETSSHNIIYDRDVPIYPHRTDCSQDVKNTTKHPQLFQSNFSTTQYDSFGYDSEGFQYKKEMKRHSKYFQLSQQFWRQGPRYDKMNDIYVDSKVFHKMMMKIVSDYMLKWKRLQTIKSNPLHPSHRDALLESSVGRQCLRNMYDISKTLHESQQLYDPKPWQYLDEVHKYLEFILFVVNDPSEPVQPLCIKMNENDFCIKKDAKDEVSSNDTTSHSHQDYVLNDSQREDVSVVDIPTIEKIFQVIVHSIEIERQHEDNRWTVRLTCGVTLEDDDTSIFESIHHLSVCVNNPLGLSPEPLCIHVQSLNYLSFIIITTDVPVLVLHLWLQVSSLGGKVSNSDVFIAADCRLSDGGWNVQTELLGETLTVDITMDHNSSITSNGATEFMQTLHFSFAALSTIAILSTPTTRQDKDQTFNSSTVIVFHCQLVNRYSLQRHVSDFCLHHHIAPFNCGNFLISLIRYIILATDMTRQNFQRLTYNRPLLPRPQYRPTMYNPFVFIHLEKTGGTTMREFIFHSARRKKINPFVPCYGGIHCVTFSLPRVVQQNKSLDLTDQSETTAKPLAFPQLENVSIVGGHFQFDVWKDLLTCQLDSSTSLVPCKPSHLVIGRHPIDRIISYYYQRCYNNTQCIGYQRKINNLEVDELEHLLLFHREADYTSNPEILIIADEGMSNAACRALCNTKYTTGRQVGRDEILIPDPLTESEILIALQNIEMSVVGILDRWEDSLYVIGFWFPWLELLNDRNRKRMNLYSNKESMSDLRQELQDIILIHNHCDLLLYKKMEQMFDVELSILNGNHYFNLQENNRAP